jgi:proline iminopeptidase
MDQLNSHYALSKGEHYAPLNNVIIHYMVSGSGPVCLCPSQGWSPYLSLLKNSLKPLEQYFTMVYYKKLLAGKPDPLIKSPKDSRQEFIDDIDAMRSYLKLDKIWIIGYFSGTPSAYIPQ